MALHDEFLDQLRTTRKAIIVEGKKDRDALVAIGVREPIVLRGPLFSVIERVAAEHTDVILLTDLDREGKRLFAILARGLRERGVRVDTRPREYLFRHTDLRQIEGIRSIAAETVPKIRRKRISSAKTRT